MQVPDVFSRLRGRECNSVPAFVETGDFGRSCTTLKVSRQVYGDSECDCWVLRSEGATPPGHPFGPRYEVNSNVRMFEQDNTTDIDTIKLAIDKLKRSSSMSAQPVQQVVMSKALTSMIGM